MVRWLASHSILRLVSYLVSEMKKILDKTHQLARVGLIATGDSFVAGQEKIDRIKEHFPTNLLSRWKAAIAQVSRYPLACLYGHTGNSDTVSHDANVSLLMNLAIEALRTLGRTLDSVSLKS